MKIDKAVDGTADFFADLEPDLKKNLRQSYDCLYDLWQSYDNLMTMTFYNKKSYDKLSSCWTV